MKRALMCLLTMYAVVTAADELKVSQPVSSEVIHVATALDHLTVLEFGEPVTMAAVGSPAFQIERHGDKVFIKPLNAGASTDLFIWTASRRFAYELEPPGEVKNMNFAVDSRFTTPDSVPDSSVRLEEIADRAFTRAFLDAEHVDSASIKEAKDCITVRIEHVFQYRNNLYIHYSVHNQSARPYRVSAPAVAEAIAPHATISIMSLQHTQLDNQLLHKLGHLRERRLTLARAELQKEDIQAGEETQGVVAIRELVAGPTILQLTFAQAGSHPVQATMVF
ncbi:MAG TPA: TrbG/VirB9 family P-type conjugative transfer protein [Candidatus Angelobacter sp.]|nr:TrbG/VirB9 family P-type conjugative transfer protein [Candidatus Angelobacter sp.]